MPPKKKPVPAARVSKQESLKETLPELQIGPKRIPKKPFFRNLEYDTPTKVQHIRVKLWKIRSCSRAHPYDGANNVDPSGLQQPEEPFKNTFKSPTIKKSFKNVKRIKFGSFYFINHQFMRNICSTWRLDSLSVMIPYRLKSCDFLKPLLHSSLKNFYFESENLKNAIDLQFLKRFRIVRKYKPFIAFRETNQINLWVNTAKLPSSRKLKLHQNVDGYWPHFGAPWFECLEEMRFANYPGILQTEKKDFDFPPLSNLQALTLALTKEPVKIVREDFSLVKQYSKLQSLKMILTNYEVESLDFLSDLPDLKCFSFLSEFEYGFRPSMKNLPNLTKLEKLKLYLHTPNMFTGEHLRDFISQNKGLKELDLNLNVQDIGTIFEENEDFNMSNIEKLRLNFTHLERPYAGTAKRIAEVLKTHHYIKELSLRFCYSYADLNTILLKDGVAKMKSLQKLTLQWRSSGGLEDNKFKNLKDVFTNQAGLVELNLEIGSDPLGTKELWMILDGLEKLPNLKIFRFLGGFPKMTPAILYKLSDLAVVTRNFIVQDFRLSGVPEEELRQQINSKLPLSEKPFSLSLSSWSDIDFRDYNNYQEYWKEFSW